MTLLIDLSVDANLQGVLRRWTCNDHTHCLWFVALCQLYSVLLGRVNAKTIVDRDHMSPDNIICTHVQKVKKYVILIKTNSHKRSKLMDCIVSGYFNTNILKWLRCSMYCPLWNCVGILKYACTALCAQVDFRWTANELCENVVEILIYRLQVQVPVYMFPYSVFFLILIRILWFV